MTDVPRSVDELIALTGPVKYLFFWGHRPQPDGRLGRGCLSQWWPAEFTIDAVRFRTAEHYMMWRKATLFGDTAMAERILEAEHPRDAKMLGRGVAGFDDRKWVAERFEIVVTGSVAKFGQSDDLRAWLVGTGDRVLVEASPTDRVWGIGLAASDERASDPVRWRGLNLLGFALMRAREQLRSR
ncbi:NADAR family protein [Actinoplanes sp. NPDC051411]|uniref:NADAR family protein n=1 Tax=Actinoplanes sp. NPDC051411 TaxID=3155522 RepID=UPI003446270F